ncbi:MAG: chemotaxis protein CheC [Nitrospinae bacterium]|nr:chemotaxis protein CheC [Nitrospinota bacterium]
MKIEKFSDEHLDFITEMMNIGAGNAANALSILLDSKVEVKQPKVNIEFSDTIVKRIGDLSLPVLCVKIAVVGDLFGDMFFILPEKDKEAIVHLAEMSIIRKKRKGQLDLSAVKEIANILAGTYLTAIHDFCKIKVYHSVPNLIIDMVQSIFDEYLASVAETGKNFIVVENEFTVMINDEREKTPTSSFKLLLVLAPNVDSIQKLAGSSDEAKKILNIR